MKVIADLCVIPIGIGVSVSKEVAICERILAAAGLKTQMHAYGTDIEGDWDRVFAAVKECHEALHGAGAPRISTSMRFGTRIDREQTMEDKIRSVEEKLISDQWKGRHKKHQLRLRSALHACTSSCRALRTATAARTGKRYESPCKKSPIHVVASLRVSAEALRVPRE